MSELLFDTLPRAVSLSRQIQAVEREIKLRHRVYQTRVANKRMSSAQAHEEIACMQAVLATLRKVEGASVEAEKLRLHAFARGVTGLSNAEYDALWAQWLAQDDGKPHLRVVDGGRE